MFTTFDRTNRIGQLLALAILAVYLLTESGMAASEILPGRAGLVPILIFLLVVFIIAYRAGVFGSRKSAPAARASAPEGAGPFGQTGIGKTLRILFVPAIFFPVFLLPLGIVYGVGALLHRARASGRLALPRVTSGISAVQPRQFVSAGDPWGTPKPLAQPTASPKHARTAVSAEKGSTPALTKKLPRHAQLETPFSDAVLRKAREDPFARLRRRYPNLR